ncbi:MAG: 50S ribosomal protein L5 [Candidatus Omnitrophica bacterium]|nr:50S ribosomal protein L5 [Candidatus Omnitrophota bacterium]
MPRLLEKYRNQIIPQIQERSNLKNRYAVPRLEKIVVNMGVGEAINDFKILEKCKEELALITGQMPVIRKAKKAISNFKLREAAAVGLKVTLRRGRMYDFLDRLINVVLPRIRDFRGVSDSSFDKKGNFSLGISEQTIFPEIDYDRVSRVQGMNITIVFKNTKSSEESHELLKLFGMPFQVRS